MGSSLENFVGREKEPGPYPEGTGVPLRGFLLEKNVIKFVLEKPQAEGWRTDLSSMLGRFLGSPSCLTSWPFSLALSWRDVYAAWNQAEIWSLANCPQAGKDRAALLWLPHRERPEPLIALTGADPG